MADNSQGNSANNISQQHREKSPYLTPTPKAKRRVMPSGVATLTDPAAITRVYNNTYGKNNTSSTSAYTINTSQSMGSLYYAKLSNKEASQKLNMMANRVNKMSQDVKKFEKQARDIQQKTRALYQMKTTQHMNKQGQKKMIELEENPVLEPIESTERCRCQCSKNFYFKKNRLDAQALKRQLVEIFHQKAKEDESHLENMRWKAQQIRQSYKQAKIKQQEDLLKKKQAHQLEQLMEFQKEEKQRQQKEEVLKKLEQLENEKLIQLNNTKQQKQTALDDLDYCQVHNLKQINKQNQMQMYRNPKLFKRHSVSKYNNKPPISLGNDKKGNVYINEAK